jgi:hypothetical protein
MNKKTSNFKKAEYVFTKLANINFKLLMPALTKAKVHKNTQGVIVDIIGRKPRLANLTNKSPDRAIQEAFKVLKGKNPKQVKLIYTPQGHKALRGIGAGKYGEYVFKKLGGYPFKVLKISKLPKSITKIVTPFSNVAKDLVRTKNTLTATQWKINQVTDPRKLLSLHAEERKLLRKRKILKSTILN